MIALFAVGLILGVVIVTFALQNTEIITVTFFSWEFTGSLALILFLTVAAGMVVTVFLILPKSISNYFKYQKVVNENRKLDEEIRKQKEVIVFAERKIPAQAEISSIENGNI